MNLVDPTGSDNELEQRRLQSREGVVKRVQWKLGQLVLPRRYMVGTLGRRVRIARSTRIAGGACVRLDDDVNIAGMGWILVPGWEQRLRAPGYAIHIGAGTSVGESCTVSAVSHVHIGSRVLFGPRVWVTDHNHVYSNTDRPILSQGWTTGGFVDIEDNCWIGTGAVIIGAKGLRIGRGSVVGANSVVTTDVPPHSVVVGNPARVVKEYDPTTNTWGTGDSGRRLPRSPQ